MSGFGLIAGGLLEGVGVGIADSAKQAREDARLRAEREARAADMQRSADLNDRNAARNDERGLANRTAEIGLQTAATKDIATANNGLLLKRDAAQNAHDDKRQQAGFAHDNTIEMMREAHANAQRDWQAVRDGKTVSSTQTAADGTLVNVMRDGSTTATGVKAKPKTDESGYTPGDTRMVKALTARFTAEDGNGAKTTDYAKVASTLAEQGRYDLAADFDPQWRGQADRVARGEKPLPNGTKQVTTIRNKATGAIVPSELAPTSTKPSPAAATPPAPGARQAPDGKWYISDPARPGKYLLVR